MVDQIAPKTLKPYPHLSIIIPSFNGAHRITTALEALCSQTLQDFETIVVIDGSTDQTRNVVESFTSRLDLHIVEQDNKGRAGARNAGAAVAKSEIFVFLDDDMRPERNWLGQHTHFHNRVPNAVMIGRTQSDPQKSQTDFDRYLALKSVSWMDDYARIENPMRLDNLFFSSANCSIPKALLNQLNGFDEKLRDAEDFDLGYRLLKVGVPIHFNEECIAWHDDFPDLKKHIQRQRQYGKAWTKLIEIRPQILRDTNRYRPHPPGGVKGLLFRIFACRRWIKIANSRAFQLILPEKARFKMYGVIIAALGRFYTHIKIS